MNLRLLQLSDSAIPIGGYTQSWGLETAIMRRIVKDPESLEQWTRSWLCHVFGPFESALATSGFRAAIQGNTKQLFTLNHLANVSILPQSIRTASREMGEQLASLAFTWAWSAEPFEQIVGQSHEGWHHCIIFGVLGALSGSSLHDVLTAYIHQATLGMISTGVRAIPVGHTHGQQILSYLHDDITQAIHDACASQTETIGSGCPFYEVLCYEQTQLYARMFRS